VPRSLNKKERAGLRNEKNSTESTVHNTDTYLQSLMATKPLQEPIMRRTIHALNLPQGSRGLDAGSACKPSCSQWQWDPPDMSQVLICPRSFWIVREALQKRRASLSRSPFRGGHEQPPVRRCHLRLGLECELRRIRTRRAPAATKGACAGGKARWKYDHHCMVFATIAPGLSLTGGTSECDIFRDRPVC